MSLIMPILYLSNQNPFKPLIKKNPLLLQVHSNKNNHPDLLLLLFHLKSTVFLDGVLNLLRILIINYLMDLFLHKYYYFLLNFILFNFLQLILHVLFFLFVIIHCQSHFYSFLILFHLHVNSIKFLGCFFQHHKVLIKLLLTESNLHNVLNQNPLNYFNILRIILKKLLIG